jgi:hypothetical protein
MSHVDRRMPAIVAVGTVTAAIVTYLIACLIALGVDSSRVSAGSATGQPVALGFLSHPQHNQVLL